MAGASSLYRDGGHGFDDARIALLNPATGTYQTLFSRRRGPHGSRQHLLFYRPGRYFAVPFDLTSLKVTGEPFAVLEGAREIDPAGDWPQPVATAASGVVTYFAGPTCCRAGSPG